MSPRVHRRPSISEAVAVVAERNYVVYEALRMKVVNYHALAEKLTPRVEELVGKKPKTESLVVAIKRFSDRLVSERFAGLEEVLGSARVTLSGGMVAATVAAKGTASNALLQELCSVALAFSGHFNAMVISDGVKMVAEPGDAAALRHALGRRYRVTLEEHVATIEIRLGQNAERTPGVATFITELLYRNGVMIKDAYIGRPEIVLVMEERFGSRAYDVLQSRERRGLGRA